LTLKVLALLIDAACQPISWSDYRDDSAEQLRNLIQAKLEGRTLAAPAPEEVSILPLVDALKRSVAQALQESRTGTSAAVDFTPEANPSPKKRPTRKTPSKTASRRSA
jgi:non-homologous end joining protein Ku